MAIFGRTESDAAPRGEEGIPSGPAPPTVVGPKARFVGELFGDEDVLVDGRFEGKIRIDRKVTVGPKGDVVGDVLGRSVVVAGRVEGQIVAQERAELLATAAVQGSVKAPRVVIHEGAQLQGSVAMAGQEAAPGPEKKAEPK